MSDLLLFQQWGCEMIKDTPLGCLAKAQNFECISSLPKPRALCLLPSVSVPSAATWSQAQLCTNGPRYFFTLLPCGIFSATWIPGAAAKWMPRLFPRLGGQLWRDRTQRSHFCCPHKVKADAVSQKEVQGGWRFGKLPYIKRPKSSLWITAG